MKEFTTIAELAAAKTREEIVKWSAEMGKCPYDYGGEAVPEEICKGGDDGEQCNQCWLAALKDIKCKGDEEPEKITHKSKAKKAQEKADNEIMSHMSEPRNDDTKPIYLQKILMRALRHSKPYAEL